MTAHTVPDTALTFVGRSRLRIGSSLLALVILGTTSIAFANGQLPGLQ
jgi:hypothetical protein